MDIAFSDQMITKNIKIINKLGMHARAAAKFVSLASGFASKIELERGQRKVNGKSIMGVMMLAASQGTTVTLYAKGNDENEAVTRLEDLVNDKFGEEE